MIFLKPPENFAVQCHTCRAIKMSDSTWLKIQVLVHIDPDAHELFVLKYERGLVSHTYCEECGKEAKEELKRIRAARL